MKKSLLIGLIAAAFVAAGGFYWIQFDTLPFLPAKEAGKNGGDGNGGGKDKKGDDRPNAVPVEVSQTVRGDISAFLLFSSTVESESAVMVRPHVGGLVQELFVEAGDRVEAGQVLLRLEDDEERIAAAESRLREKQLAAEFGRVEEMYRNGMATEQEFETRSFALEQARLTAQRNELQLEHTRVRSPIDGVVTLRNAQVGDRVTASVDLFEIVNLDEMITRVHLPEKHFTSVNVGQEARIRANSLGGEGLEGWVKRVSPAVDPASGTFRVTVGLKTEDTSIPPGLFVNVEIITATHEDTVLLPKRAVVYEGEERFVFIVEEDRVKRTRVEAGLENGDYIEVSGMLDSGAAVVVRGQRGLKDGTRVRVVQSDGVEASS